MPPRLLIAGVVCLVVLGAGGATYLFRDSLFGSGASTLIGASGIEAERKPPPLRAQSLPPEPPTSGSPTGAPAASSGQPGPRAPSADELVNSLSKLKQQEQAAGESAGDTGLNATLVPSPANSEAKPVAEGLARDETAPPAKVAENPAQAKSQPAPPPSVPNAERPAETEAPVPHPANPEAEAVAKSSAESKAEAETAPPAKVEAKPLVSVRLPAEPPAKPDASPVIETPVKDETAPVPHPTNPEAEPVAESPAKDETAPPEKVEAKPLPLVSVTPPTEPPANPEASPVIENPAKDETTPVPPPANPEAKPVAESSTKDETAPSARVAENPAGAETHQVRPLANPEAKPVAKSQAKVEAKPMVSVTPPADSPTKPEASPVSESPAKAGTPPLPSPASSEAKPVAESSAKDEMASPAKVEAKPIASVTPPAESPAKPEIRPVAESSANAETEPPAKGDAKPAEPAPKPDASASNATEAGGTGAGQGQVAAIVPPRAPQAMLAIDDATVGKDYAADLPPFSDPNGAKGIALHVEPRPPEGLSFIDLGSGFGEISGRPTKPGQFAFDVVASNNVGGAARMTTKINVAPAPSEPKPQPPKSDANSQVAALEPMDKAARFLRGFDGGPCFLARAGAAVGDSIAIEGVGAEKQAFQRFYASFVHDVGVEPTLTVRLIASPQCPAVGLIAAAQPDRTLAPTIKLAAYDVPRGKPLAGSIGALAGRRLDLLLITNDGLAHKIVSRGLASDQSALFSVPITPDAGSIGALQILLAIASSKPLDALAAFRSGPAADILPKVAAQLRPNDAALNVEYFRFLK